MFLLTLLIAHSVSSPTLSFAFFGCNRVDAADLDPVKNPSSANQAQLAQTLKEVVAAKPALLFAGGDLVNNYADDDGTVLRNQLNGWANETSWLPKKIGLVVVPGNHELNKKVRSQRMPSTLTYPIWNAFVASNRHVFVSNGPNPAHDPQDQLVLDESRFSYTLNRKGVRFIVLNTDTRTSATDPVTGTALGWIPAHWACEQLAAAEKDPSVHAVFVLGHRNLIDPSEGTGDAPVDKRAADILVAGMQGKKKLRAYVCAHVHAWNVRTIPGTSAMQIISGDGGSKLETDAKEEFGWVEIKVSKDGTASYIHHHRPMPHPYNSPVPILPTVDDAPVPIQ